MQDLNPIQMHILKIMLFIPQARFSELNTEKIPNDQFSYHLRVLQENGLIIKNEYNYSLTTVGKEYADRMDTETKKIERQPKVSVLIIAKRIYRKKMQFVVQTRLKEPYYGYKGFLTGKVRFGETIEEAGKRELKEETGLGCKIKHIHVLHEMVYNKEGEILEDKFFNIVEAYDVTGELRDDEGCHNEWMSEEEFYNSAPKFHNEEEIYSWYKVGNVNFKEKKYYIEQF